MSKISTLHFRKNILRTPMSTSFNKKETAVFTALSIVRQLLRDCMEGRAVASEGVSGARPPHFKSVPPISRLANRLLRTSNTVFLKCVAPFWFLALPSGCWPPCCSILATGLTEGRISVDIALPSLS